MSPNDSLTVHNRHRYLFFQEYAGALAFPPYRKENLRMNSIAHTPLYLALRSGSKILFWDSNNAAASLSMRYESAFLSFYELAHP